MAPVVHARALLRAAQILGGKERLCERLRVASSELDAWLAGKATPPIDVFLLAVDVINAPPHASRPAMEFLEARFGPGEANAVAEAALGAALAGTGADMGNVQLRFPEGLRIAAQRGFERPFLDFFALVNDSGSACGTAMQQGRRIIVPEVASDPIFAGTPAAGIMAQAYARAVQSTPLLGSAGRLLGVLSTHYDRPRAPSEGELDLLDRIATHAAFWLDRGSL